VRTAAHDWQTKREREPGKDFDYLRWPAERLTLVYAMRERLKPELNEVEQDFIEPEQNRLLRELETLPKDDTSHERRRDIGDRLAVIGDTRPGVGVKDGVPDMRWLPVSGSGEPVIIKTDEREIGPVLIAPFFSAQYLVTYAQFQAFVDAEDGFNDPRWWAEMPDDYQRQELASQRTKVKNAPRDSVSWYQAVAFGRWLNHRCWGLVIPNPLVGMPFLASEYADGLLPVPTNSAWVIGTTAEIRLPTEWEWQWLAQGGRQANAYPWGEWHAGYANTSEAGLSRTTAVGMYPQGAAGCGALDVAGNLFEWCLNDYAKPEVADGYGNGERKVLRGGSFSFNQGAAAASCRDYDPPRGGGNRFGLRLAVFPISAL
jgi:formylglycine-generating enzyme required for sulfatase activity